MIQFCIDEAMAAKIARLRKEESEKAEKSDFRGSHKDWKPGQPPGGP